MIEIIETIIPESKKSKEIKYCDICGINLDEQCNFGEPGDDNDSVNFYAEGNVYPGEDNRLYTIFDLCMKCTRDKVFPLIEKEFGIKARKWSK